MKSWDGRNVRICIDRVGFICSHYTNRSYYLLSFIFQNALLVRDNPTPVLLALLCFFHIMVYWLNTHHFLKYSPDNMSIVQVWCMALFCLGLVVYPLSLAMWIENGNNDSYYYINTGCCFIMMIFNIATPVDDNANDLFKLYHKAAPSTAFLFYSVATILNWQGVEGSKYMLYVAPFCFVMVCYCVLWCLCTMDGLYISTDL